MKRAEVPKGYNAKPMPVLAIVGERRMPQAFEHPKKIALETHNSSGNICKTLSLRGRTIERCAGVIFRLKYHALEFLVAVRRKPLDSFYFDVQLPIKTIPLQACVSEPVKPVLDCVVMSNTVHVYVSQSDKGELVIGAGIDAFNSYAQRGSFHVIEGQVAALLELFPVFSRLKMLRSWAGIVDVSPDASPIIGLTPVRGLYLDCGWGTGGFKATPASGWVLAHTVANDAPHELNRPYSLERFTTGALIDEHGAAGVAH